MRKTLLIATFFLAVTLCIQIAAAEAPFRCGIISAQTGPLSPIGTAIKNSVTMASQTNPQSKQVEFLFEDDQFQAKNTVAAVRKLLDVNKVNCLITFGSTTSLAVADIAEQAKIPMISIAITPKVVENRPHVFRAYVPIEKQNAAIVSELNKRKYESVAVITTIQDATLALRDAFIASKPTKVVYDEQVNPEDRDFNTLITKIRTFKPAAVFLNLLPPQASIFAKQLKSVGYQGELFSGPPLGNPAEIQAASGALFGAWFVSVDNSKAQGFYDAYQKTFNETPPVEAIYGFDSANLIMDSVGKGDLFESLRSLKTFKGLMGEYGVVQNTFDFPAGVWRVTINGFEYCGNEC